MRDNCDAFLVSVKRLPVARDLMLFASRRTTQNLQPLVRQVREMHKPISLFLLTAAIAAASQPTIAAATTSSVTSWVYYDGKFDWPGDYSFAASADYHDVSGEPRSGRADIKVSVTSAWGAWAPYPRSPEFNAKPYTALTVSLKPTVANQKWQIFFEGLGGKALPSECTRNVASYGPAPRAGVWATYTIPLSALCVAGSSLDKLVIQDQTGLSDNTWFVDNVGFDSPATKLPAPTPTSPVAAPTPAPTPAPPVATPIPVPVTPPVSPSPPVTAGTSWVFFNGSFDWPGDFSFSATADYRDTSGDPLSGSYDTKVTLTGPWGGWLPYAHNFVFNDAGYKHLTFSLKPTVDNQAWHLYFVAEGDHALPNDCTVNVLDYGPAPVAGKWATYTVPLSALCVANTSVYKFAIQDQTGLAENTWYVDNVGFAP